METIISPLKAATRPDLRTKYENEEKLWRQIADQVDAYDEAERGWEASERVESDTEALRGLMKFADSTELSDYAADTVVQDRVGRMLAEAAAGVPVRPSSGW